MTTLYPIINCARCNQVFRQILRDLCPECIAQEEQNAGKIALALKQSASQGGMALEELAQALVIPADDILALYEEGFFHQEARWLLKSCHKCLQTFPIGQFQGDCCTACFGELQREVGEDLRLQEFLREQEALARDGKRHYGLKKPLSEKHKDYYRF